MWPFTISEAERLRLIEEERRRNRWRKLKFWKRPPVKLLVPTVGQRCAACCLPALCILGSIYLIHQICIRKRKEKLKRSVRAQSPPEATLRSTSLSSSSSPVASTKSMGLTDHTRSIRDRHTAKVPTKLALPIDLNTTVNSSRTSKLQPMLSPTEAYQNDLTQSMLHPKEFAPPDATPRPPARPRMLRRSSMPNAYSDVDIPLKPKKRAQSLEQTMKSSVHSGISKKQEDGNHSQQPPGEVLMDFLHGMEHGGSVCGSVLGDASVGSVGSRELARLVETIDRRRGSIGSDASKEREIQQMQLKFLGAQRRGSIVSVGGMSSAGSLDTSGATLERLMAARRGSTSSMHSSLSSIDRMQYIMSTTGQHAPERPRMTRSSSKHSVASGDSSMLDAFYDPAADVPPYLTIYYATQSGTSEFYAYALHQEGRTMGMDVGICNVNNLFSSVDIMSLDQELSEILIPHQTKSGKKRGRAVFLISTYHDGGPTEDGVGLLNMLKEMNDPKYLKGLRYAVFGFGNSSYTNTFNSQGKLYDQLLANLGGKRMVPLALGDDGKDVDWDFEQWKWKVFWPKFAEISAKDSEPVPPPDAGQVSQEPIKKNTREAIPEDRDSDYALEYISEADVAKEKEYWDQVDLQAPARHFREVVEYSVKSIRPLWRDPDLPATLKQQPGSTMHMELDLNGPKGPPFLFKTGDSVLLLPLNKSGVVKSLAKQLGYDLDATFILRPAPGVDEAEFELPFPTPCTVRDYLSKYCELTTPPRRSVVRALSKCATDYAEREEIYKLSSKKNRQDYLNKVVKDNVGLAEFIMVRYPSIAIPLDKFISLCFPMQSRWYSASNSTLMHPDSLHLTFNVVSIVRTDGSICQGCASHHMANLKPYQCIRVVQTSNSAFLAPPEHSKPLILIANGSGIAPMRALIQERHFQKSNLKFPVGPTELFFGIRRRDLDFLYQDEFAYYKNSGSLSALYLASSREQLHKIYVQHLVAKHAEHVWKLLKRGAHVYVCGGSSMRSEVDQVLRAIISRQLGADKVIDFMKNLVADGRYVHEAFDAKHVREQL